MDVETYALAKAYTDKEIAGGGAVKGKNCVITEIEDVEGAHIVHFQWTLDDGTVETDTMTVKDGDLVEASETNGNIKINGTETQVYNDAEVKADIEELQDIVSDEDTTKEGNPLNFTTRSAQKSKSTILTLEPIQDLHGYDKPWVGGAGKNKLPMTVAGLKSANTSGTWSDNVYTLNGVAYTLLADSDNNIISISANGQASANSTLVLIQGVNPPFNNMILSHGGNGGSSNSFFMGYTKKTSPYTVFALAYSTEKTIEIPEGHETDDYFLYIRVASGYNAQNVILYPMVRVSGTSTTFEPYTNLCPISGRSEIGILGCGKNLLENTLEAAKQQIGITCYTDADGIITITGSGNNITSPFFFLQGSPTSYPLLLKAGSYKLSQGVVLPTSTFLRVTDNNGTIAQCSDTDSIEFTLSNDTYVNVYLRVDKDSSWTTPMKVYPMIVKSTETDSNFAPYTESTDLTINLGQTVYGGTLDVENGVLVVDKGIIDLGNLTWEIVSGSRFLSRNEMPNVLIDTNYKIKRNAICSQYEWVEGETLFNENVYGYAYYIESDQNRLFVKDLRYSSASDFKDAMDGVQLVYELATPITINLTPHTIKLLEGVNNISTDGDSITLTYRDGSVATLGDLTSAVDNLDSKIDESKILTDTATGDKYILVVTNGVLDIQQVSN